VGHTLEPSALFDELGLRLLVHLAPDGYHPVLHPDAKPARVDPEMVEQVALDLIVDLGIGSLEHLEKVVASHDADEPVFTQDRDAVERGESFLATRRL